MPSTRSTPPSACGSTTAPNGHAFIALLAAFRPRGGTAPGEIVSSLLEERQVASNVGLAKLVETGRVFGFRWRATLWIPMFQFDADDLAPKVGAQRVRAELPQAWRGWMLASWFAAPSPALGGRSAVAMLASDLDADFDAVLRAARLEGPADELLAPPVHAARPIRPEHALVACV